MRQQACPTKLHSPSCSVRYMTFMALMIGSYKEEKKMAAARPHTSNGLHVPGTFEPECLWKAFSMNIIPSSYPHYGAILCNEI